MILATRGGVLLGRCKLRHPVKTWNGLWKTGRVLGLASLFVFVVGRNQPVNHPNPLLITFFTGTKLLEHSHHSLREYAMISQCHMTSLDMKSIVGYT